MLKSGPGFCVIGAFYGSSWRLQCHAFCLSYVNLYIIFLFFNNVLFVLVYIKYVLLSTLAWFRGLTGK